MFLYKCENVVNFFFLSNLLNNVSLCFTTGITKLRRKRGEVLKEMTEVLLGLQIFHTMYLARLILNFKYMYSCNGNIILVHVSFHMSDIWASDKLWSLLYSFLLEFLSFISGWIQYLTGLCKDKALLYTGQLPTFL